MIIVLLFPVLHYLFQKVALFLQGSKHREEGLQCRLSGLFDMQNVKPI